MAVKLISLFALFALLSVAHSATVVTTYAGDSTCSSQGSIVGRHVSETPCFTPTPTAAPVAVPVAAPVSAPVATGKRNVEQAAVSCAALPGAINGYYYKLECAVNTPTVLSNLQAVSISPNSTCSYIHSRLEGPIGSSFWFGYHDGMNVIATKFNSTCNTQTGVLTTGLCFGNDCFLFNLPRGQCTNAVPLGYGSQTTCATAAVPTQTTPTRRSSASLVAGSATLVTLLALF